MLRFTVRNLFLLLRMYAIIGHGELGPHGPLAGRDHPALEEHAQRRGLRV